MNIAINVFYWWFGVCVFFLFLILQGCAKPQQSQIDPQLQPYINQFVIEAQNRGIYWVNAQGLSVSLSNSMPAATVSGGETLGYCQIGLQGESIVINLDAFNSFNDSDREQLVFHECGHCILNLKHNNDLEEAPAYEDPSIIVKVPSSIMNAEHFREGVYNSNRTAYLDRLFGVSNSKLFYDSPSEFNDNY